MRLAGKRLIQAQLKDTKVKGELWDSKQKPGYSQERWTFWRDRLKVIEKNEGYEDEAREFAGRARNILEQLMEGEMIEG